LGWIRQLAGLASSWSGASSPDPVIRLRTAMPEPTMGEMARWTFYQRFIAERTKDIDPRSVEAWMRLEHPTLDGLSRQVCSVQRLPARLVTTPQTVHSFTRESSMGWLARSIRLRCYACGTMSASARPDRLRCIRGGAAFGPSGDRRNPSRSRTALLSHYERPTPGAMHDVQRHSDAGEPAR
jgi:hypothetical protein